MCIRDSVHGLPEIIEHAVRVHRVARARKIAELDVGPFSVLVPGAKGLERLEDSDARPDSVQIVHEHGHHGIANRLHDRAMVLLDDRHDDVEVILNEPKSSCVSDGCVQLEMCIRDSLALSVEIFDGAEGTTWRIRA